MCGRFALSGTLEDLYIAIKIQGRFNFQPRYNFAPSQPIMITRYDPKGDLELTHVTWGLVPSWMKAPPTSTTLINARIETVHEKPSFRSAYKYRRCLIPASGFYEWQKTGGPKQPYYIFRKDQPIMTFAGLWEHWQSPEGTEIETAAIITAPASKSIEGIHHRMPVVVKSDDQEDWLKGDKSADEVLQPQLGFDFHPVSTAVNNVRNEDKSLVQKTQLIQSSLPI